MSLTSICGNWMRENPDFKITTIYVIADDLFKVRMEMLENGKAAVATIPARKKIEAGSPVVVSILETLRNQLLLNTYYDVVI